MIGSFLNVVIARLPEKDKEKQSLGGRSRCPKCGAHIRAGDNIPVLSWLILRGKCRDCKQPIAARYPLVEMLNCALWAAVAADAATTGRLVRGVVLMSLLVAITFIDIDHRIIPNRLTGPGTVVGLALSIAFAPQHWLEFTLSSLCAGAFLLVTALVYPAGMGGGAIKMAAVMGAFLGRAVVIGLFAGFVAGAVVSIFLLVRHGSAARKIKIPFGP